MAVAQGHRIGKPCSSNERGSSVGLMTHLTSVELWQDTEVHVRFSTSLDLTDASDTAVLQLVHGGGSELGIRIERGRVTDVYVWDAVQLIRQRLGEGRVLLSSGSVQCSIPTPVLPAGTLWNQLGATLIVNGAPVQTRFPVTMRQVRLPSPARTTVGASRP